MKMVMRDKRNWYNFCASIISTDTLETLSRSVGIEMQWKWVKGGDHETKMNHSSYGLVVYLEICCERKKQF